MMKALFTGGVKSGKSRHAEHYCLEIPTSEKPVYLATSEFRDAEIEDRIEKHKERRGNDFLTVEEPLAISEKIQQFQAPVLVECMTMWINNMLYHQNTEQDILHEAERLSKLPNAMVFVLNEVGLGIIPDNPLSRKFVDISGKVAQLLGDRCDEVFLCVAGQKLKVK